MSKQYLLLWLEAPLQAWGHDSRFGRRDSLDFPTKSGVLGLLACAMGAGGAQREWLAKTANYDMQVHAYVRKDWQGEAIPRLPLLRDFHMVGAGYDSKSPWESLLIPKTNEGKPAVGGGVKLTYRYYVQDMAYAVILAVSTDELASIAEVLQAPVWDLYLGRKNCVPTEFIYQGVFDVLEAAEHQANHLANTKNRTISFRVYEGDCSEALGGELLSLNDVPVQFGERKIYRDRRVTVVSS